MKQIFLILCLLPFLLVPAAAQQSKSVFIPGDAYTAYNIPAGGSALQLNINRANNNLVIDDSEILLQDASDAVQWYRSSAGPALHVYQIGTVLSSREYVHVFGHYHYTNGSGGGTPPMFNAKVAAVDVDMTSVTEEDEESVGIWLGKNGARKAVTIQAVQCKGPGNEQELAWSSGKLSLWSAASGGSMLPGNSKSLSASQAYTYYAQGDVASRSVRDSEISITYAGGNGTACDKIKVTVVSASLTSFEIIPANTTQEVSVTVAPNPPGTNITLQLSCLAGSGSAVFIPGDTTLSNITQSTTVKTKGVTASSVASNMILKAMLGNDVLASNVFTVLSVDLDIWNGGSDLDNGQTAGSQGAQVPEGGEVSTGAYVLVNWDDDDADGTMNADGTWSALPVPDLTENSVADEGNLAKLKPTVEPLLDTGTIELEVSGADAGKVKLWTQSTKGTEVTLISNKKTWNLANSTEKADFQTFMNDGYWIEGTDVGTAERGVTFTVRYKDSGGTEICKDDNKATGVMINLANVVARDNMIDIWGIGQNSRGHSALVWRYAGTCTKADLTNDVNFILIEMGGPTDNRNITTITQQAGYPAYGCFRNPSMTYVQRLRIIRAARALAASAPITCTATDAVQPYDWDGALNTLTALRCDSLVEVCYEINGVEVWGMERDADSHTVHYMINDQADNWSYNATWGTWTAGANNLPDNLEEHNDFDLIGWADTFMPATQCGNVAPDEADTQVRKGSVL